MVERIRFRTKKDGVYPLGKMIQECIDKTGIKSGLLCAFIPHTTAALTVNSFWDPLGHEDLMDEIRRLIPTRIDFKHQHDTPEDAAGHVKSTLIGPSITFIVDEGKLLLGHSQEIYFLEFDGPRNRECCIKIISEEKQSEEK